MAARLITCELKHESEKTDYASFYEVIRSYDFIQLTETSFAVATDEYPKDLFEKLFPYVDEDDTLVVIALARFYMAHHDKNVLEWLNKNV